MSVKETVERISKLLKDEGFDIYVSDEEGIILKAHKNDLKIDITFDFEEKFLNRLLVSSSNRPGVTILKCDAPEKVENCIKKLTHLLSKLR